MTTPTTPPPTVEDRRTTMEKRWDAILPTLATKDDVDQVGDRLEARFDRVEVRFDRLEAKLDAMANRLLLWGSVIMIAMTVAVVTAAFVAARFL